LQYFATKRKLNSR
jgi:hypothetical protein